MPQAIANTTPKTAPSYFFWCRLVAALFSGTLITFSLAPYEIWPLGIVSLIGLAVLLANQHAKQSFFIALFYGFGLYITGASWVHVSISNFGQTSSLVALMMTIGFALGLACVLAVPFVVYGKYFSRSAYGQILGFAAVWTLGEWSRTWFLTGFPWLYVGYSHHATWLAGWAPIIGVLGIGFICAVTATISAYILQIKSTLKNKLACMLAIVFIWLTGWGLTSIEWTTPDKTPVNMVLIQPNIPQEMKWNPAFSDAIFNTLMAQTKQYKSADLIIWPEAAIPVLKSEAGYYLQSINAYLNQSQTALITGLLEDDIINQKYYNTITGFGGAHGTYAKQRLVPFGEYVPLEEQLRGLIGFFNLPMSVMHKGASHQTLLQTAQHTFATSICYEVVYPSLVAKYAKDANAIITISNDAWFGDSIGPIQHFEMARMRALENQKPVIRVANTGISGFININGQVIAQTSQFVSDELVQDITLYSGATPFSSVKSWPIVLLCLALIAFLYYRLTYRAQTEYI